MMHHLKGLPAGGPPRFKALDSLTRRVLPVVVSTGLILGNVSVGLAAQEVVQLRESADICRDCISFETVAVLGGDYDGDNLLTGSVYVNRGASGRIYVHDFGAGGSEMFFYRADGQLEFTIRKPGEGPGEYQQPMPIVELPSGRVAVFDQDNVSCFDPGTGRDVHRIKLFPAQDQLGAPGYRLCSSGQCIHPDTRTGWHSVSSAASQGDDSRLVWSGSHPYARSGGGWQAPHHSA